MLYKFSVLSAVLVTLATISGLQGVSAGPAAQPLRCDEGDQLYCCSPAATPGGDFTLICTLREGTECVSPFGSAKCCDHFDGYIAFGCSDPK